MRKNPRSLPREAGLPSMIPILQDKAESNSALKAVTRQPAVKEYLLCVQPTLEKEFDIRLNADLDVLTHSQNVSRADYKGHYEGEPLNIEVEYKLYDLWNHDHRLTMRNAEIKPCHMDEVHYVIAVKSKDKNKDLISPRILEEWFGVDCLIIEEEPALPSYKKWTDNLYRLLEEELLVDKWS